MSYHVNFSGIFTTLTAEENNRVLQRGRLLQFPTARLWAVSVGLVHHLSRRSSGLYGDRGSVAALILTVGLVCSHHRRGGRRPVGRPAVQTGLLALDMQSLSLWLRRAMGVGDWRDRPGSEQTDCWSGTVTWSLTCDPSASHAPWSPESTPGWGSNRWDVLLLN